MSNKATSFLYVLLKNRKFVVRTLLIVMAITVGITYLLPKSYTVKTVILPRRNPPPRVLTSADCPWGTLPVSSVEEWAIPF
ncbi:MAG TPA: hypothetical protein P5207_08495, partial [Candidatus Sabulitectum sp.]|nr:hypothetical protein [Candidatus Sabulitectum sp.]